MVLTLRILWGPERNWQGKQRSRHHGVGCLDSSRCLNLPIYYFLNYCYSVFTLGHSKLNLETNQIYLTVTYCLSETELLSLIEWFNPLTTF